MSSVVKRLRDDAAPRRRDATATRAAILEAAMARFAQLGYGASLRDIAAAAGVDVALIKRYFGGKEALYTEALKASIHPDRLRAWDRTRFAGEIAEMMAGHAHADEERTHGFQFLLRAATSPTTAPMLNLAVQERFLQPIREWLGGDDAHVRARVFAATFIGFLVERLIRDEPLVGRERQVFIRRVTEVFEGLAADPPTR
ncbi:MAG TPA: TetR family transcriptional regulator [Pseudomonadales bacterium]|nr:TetR family transcriptional regulator [Pseudomonadales bacterium]